MSLQAALPQGSVVERSCPVSSKVEVATELVQPVEPWKHCRVRVVALPRGEVELAL
jgi:hypothetical protein